MALNKSISKFISLNDYFLLEYEFNKDTTTNYNYLNFEELGAKFAQSRYSGKLYYTEYNRFSSTYIGGQEEDVYTNNRLNFNSVSVSSTDSKWYYDENLYDGNPNTYINYINYINNNDNSQNIIGDFPFDTLKLHIVSGYNFQDIYGFLLRVSVDTKDNNKLYLTNFTWDANNYNIQDRFNAIKLSSNILYIGNKFYDKYIEIKIPSTWALTNKLNYTSNINTFVNDVDVKQLSNVFIEYSNINSFDNQTKTYVLADNLDAQLPIISNSDNFNALIKESSNGDYIEFYGMWGNEIIGNYMDDIENGKIPLYLSSNPNDNYASFAEAYGTAIKWVLIHEIYLYEDLPEGITKQTQKYSFTQDSNWNEPNLYRPILINSDIATNARIDYIVRLYNRMDGTQIIRKSSMAITNPKKYGKYMERLNINNLINYTAYNKIEKTTHNISPINTKENVRYVKTYVNTNNIILSNNNTYSTQGEYTMNLFTSGSLYKFVLSYMDSNNISPLELQNNNTYTFEVKLENGDTVIIKPSNVNILSGELDFNITDTQTQLMLKNKDDNKRFVIKSNSKDGTSTVIYEGKYKQL